MPFEQTVSATTVRSIVRSSHPTFAAGYHRSKCSMSRWSGSARIPSICPRLGNVGSFSMRPRTLSGGGSRRYAGSSNCARPSQKGCEMPSPCITFRKYDRTGGDWGPELENCEPPEVTHCLNNENVPQRGDPALITYSRRIQLIDEKTETHSNHVCNASTNQWSRLQYQETGHR